MMTLHKEVFATSLCNQARGSHFASTTSSACGPSQRGWFRRRNRPSGWPALTGASRLNASIVVVSGRFVTTRRHKKQYLP